VRDERASVGLLVWEVAKLAQEHGLSDTIRSLPSSQRLVSTDLVRGLEEILIDRIRTADLEADVISTLLPTVLLDSGEWDNSDRPRQYLQTVAANPLRVAPLIRAWVSGAGADGRMRSDDLLVFGRAYDLPGLFSAVRALARNPPGWLT